jgi:hypothetical protein
MEFLFAAGILVAMIAASVCVWIDPRRDGSASASASFPRNCEPVDKLDMSEQRNLDIGRRTFGGHSAAEVADLCELLAASADHGELSYSETAAIARRAAECIRYLLRDWRL